MKIVLDSKGAPVTMTLLNLKRSYSGRFNVGDIVELKHEEKNPHDKNAIAVFINGEQGGYIANSSNTVQAGTLGATDILPLIKGKVAKGKVSRLVSDTNFMSNLLAELWIEEEEKVKKIEDTSKELSFRLIGSFSLYPGKKELISQLAVSPQSVLLKKSGDKILAYFNEEMAGVVDEKSVDEEGFTLITQFVEDNHSAMVKAIANEKGNIVCELKFSESSVVSKVKVKDLIKDIIKRGIDTKENLSQKLDYLKRNKVPEIAIVTLFSSYAEYSDDIKGKIPTMPKTLYVDNGTGILAKSIAYINVGRNLLFEGDRGVGKNVLTETLAWLYNRPLYEFSSNSQHSNNALLGTQTFENDEKEDDEIEMTETAKSFLKLKNLFGKKDVNEDDLTGIQKFLHKFLKRGDGKKLKFDRSTIIEAFEVGGIIVLDEFNTSLAHVMPIFNSLLDDRRRIAVPSYGTINAHSNFCAIATQNKDYQGTFDGNEATIDRFVPVIFPSLNSIEEILQSKVPNVDYATLATCQSLFLGIKSAIQASEIDEKCMTIRGFIDACLVLEQGISLKDALIDNIANKASDLDDRKAIINMIEIQVK